VIASLSSYWLASAAMQESEQVLLMCQQGREVQLASFLEAHPDVDFNLFREPIRGMAALHVAGFFGHPACMRILIDAKCDVDVRTKSKTGSGAPPLFIACSKGSVECVKLLIEAKADLQGTSDRGNTPVHTAAELDKEEILRLLIEAKADVNAKGTRNFSPLMYACIQKHLRCTQLLVDANADLHNARTIDGISHVCATMLLNDHYAQRTSLGVTFAILSCNVDVTAVIKSAANRNINIAKTTVVAHINEYKQVQTFIDEHHEVIKFALSENVVVDKRVGRGDNGLYHEPLEQVLLYLGLSMDKNQIVNKSIDGKKKRHALIPGHPTNANLWYELYQSGYCSGCSTRVAKPKKCPCHTTRYCNSDCQRKHWKTHKSAHQAFMRRGR
jgi:ankyrin repeat protein